MFAAILIMSGCASSPPREEPEPPDARPVQDPQDFSYLDDPEQAGQPHVHDYWDGEARLTIARVNRAVERPTGHGFCVSLRPDLGRLVNPGTEHINVTAWWNHTAPTRDFEMVLRIRNDAGWPQIFPPTRLENGLSLSVPVPLNRSDLGHSPRSVWEFVFCAEAEAVAGAPANHPYSFEISAQVEIIRVSGDLPRAPPHPDFWRGNSSILLWSRNETVQASQIGGSPGTSHMNMGPVVVPASRIRLALYFNQSEDTDRRIDPRLDWHGPERYPGSDYERSDVRATTFTKGEEADVYIEWIVDVAPGQWDSPYWNETNWVVSPRWFGGESSPGDALEPRFEGNPWTGHWHFLVQAIRTDA